MRYPKSSEAYIGTAMCTLQNGLDKLKTTTRERKTAKPVLYASHQIAVVVDGAHLHAGVIESSP